jgi:hypothetical protein
MPLSFAVSDFIGSILSHVVRGYAGAVSICLAIALTRAMVIGSFTSTYRRPRRAR